MSEDPTSQKGAPKAPNGRVALRIRADRLKAVLTVLKPVPSDTARSVGSYGSPARSKYLGAYRLKFDREGMHLLSVDPSHIAMLKLDLPRSAFEEYTVTGECTVGLDATKIAEVAKLAGRTDVLEFRAGGSLALENHATLQIGHVKRTMGTIDAEGIVLPSLPKVSPNGSVAVDPSGFATVTKTAAGLSDHSFFSMKDGKDPKAETEGETDKITDPLPVVGDATGTIESQYPTGELSEMAKAIAKADAVTFGSGVDYPARLDFRFVSEAGTPWLEGFYLLAPRVDEDETPVERRKRQEAASPSAPEPPTGPEPDEPETNEPEPRPIPDTDLPILVAERAWEKMDLPTKVRYVGELGAGPVAASRLGALPFGKLPENVRDALADLAVRVRTGMHAQVHTHTDAPAPQQEPSVALAIPEPQPTQIVNVEPPSTVVLGTYRYRCGATERFSRTTYTSLDRAMAAAQAHDQGCEFYSGVFGTNPDGSKVALRSDGKRIKAWPEIEDETAIVPVGEVRA